MCEVASFHASRHAHGVKSIWVVDQMEFRELVNGLCFLQRLQIIEVQRFKQYMCCEWLKEGYTCNAN